MSFLSDAIETLRGVEEDVRHAISDLEIAGDDDRDVRDLEMTVERCQQEVDRLNGIIDAAYLARESPEAVQEILAAEMLRREKVIITKGARI